MVPATGARFGTRSERCMSQMPGSAPVARGVCRKRRFDTSAAPNSPFATSPSKNLSEKGSLVPFFASGSASLVWDLKKTQVRKFHW